MTTIQHIFGQMIGSNPFSRVQRNHALEHAALHLLARRHPALRMAGFSDAGGFRIIGDVPTADLQQAVDEALARLQQGEHSLAYHPNCGTNFGTTGVLAGLAAWLGMLRSGGSLRARVNRLPLVILLVTLVLVLGKPAGPYLQRHVTTDPRPGNLHIVEIQRHDFGHFVLHRVITRD